VSRIRLTAVIAGVAIAAMGCSGDDSATAEPRPLMADPTPPDTPTPTPTPDTFGSLADLVPDDLVGRTVILGIPPESMRADMYMSEAGGSMVGALPDLITAAADLLGMPAELRDVEGGDELEESFLDDDPVVYLIAASTNNFPTNLADLVSFVAYEERFLFREGLDIGDEPLDLCGLRIGRYETEHSEPAHQGFFAEIESVCEMEGDPLELVAYTPDDGFPVDAVVAGEIDAAPSGQVYSAHVMNQNPGPTWGGPKTGDSTTGLIVGKESGLAEPLAQALHELATTGVFGEIMERYGLPNVPPAEPMVNVVD
jgi:polar amino acid transport system substrate-binding protein